MHARLGAGGNGSHRRRGRIDRRMLVEVLRDCRGQGWMTAAAEPRWIVSYLKSPGTGRRRRSGSANGRVAAGSPRDLRAVGGRSGPAGLRVVQNSGPMALSGLVFL